jgi:hypothetical protein
LRETEIEPIGLLPGDGFWEKFIHHPEKYFWVSDLAGIDPCHLMDLGIETLLGMLDFQADRLKRNVELKYEGSDNEATLWSIDVINHIRSLLELPGISHKPCLPTFRIKGSHFQNGDKVMVFRDGEWVAGAVLMKNETVTSMAFFGGHVPYQTPVTIEIGGQEPQVLQMDLRDAALFKLEEYEYLAYRSDSGFLEVLQKNVASYEPGSSMDKGIQNAAIRKLISLSLCLENKIYSYRRIGEELMIFFQDAWIKARVLVLEEGDCPAVVDLLREPMLTIPLLKGAKTLPMDLWEENKLRYLKPE